MAIVGLAALCLLGLFSTELADTDFWWHLKTGQFVVARHALPVPDPFAFTTPAGEGGVLRFNLTHEWLGQVLLYLVFATGGFPAVILVRAALLAAFCGLAGRLAASLSRSFPTGIAAAGAAASIAVEFAADRPALVTFLGVAVFVTVLESRRRLWALPPLALLWANCHGGFFLAWVVLLAYCAEFRAPDRRRVWLVSAASIALSGLNPNGFGVLRTLVAYRRSPLTANLVEWQPPNLWGPPFGFPLLLTGAVLVLALAWRKVRLSHWLLFAAFAGAALLAFRNLPLIAFLAPALIAGYFPYRFSLPRAAVTWGLPAALAMALIAGTAGRSFFQLRVADWTNPSGAADFVLSHHLTGPLFNTYEQGGYLIWRWWPEARVFIDGRALSERVYSDYRQILVNAGAPADQVSGPRRELLDRYGVRVVVMNTLDWVSGALYPLAIALGNPADSEWQLVYEDTQDVVFVRHPAPGTPVLDNKFGRLLRHLNTECAAYIEHSPDTPLCARTLAEYWMRNQAPGPARQMLRLYLAHTRAPDPKALEMARRLGTAP